MALDAELMNSANAYSSEYADLVSLTARQAMAALEFTLPKNESGSWDLSDVKAFVKDLGNIASGGYAYIYFFYS